MNVIEKFKNGAVISRALKDMGDQIGAMIDADDIDFDDADDALAATRSAEAVEVPAKADVFTEHAKQRLAILESLDRDFSGIDDNVSGIVEHLGKLQAANRLAQSYVEHYRSDVRRANDLEIANAAYKLAVRKVTLEMKTYRAESERLAIETARAADREKTLTEENQSLTTQLEEAQYKVSGFRRDLAVSADERAQLAKRLATISALAERHGRDNEILRQKNAAIASDAATLKRNFMETNRKFDELTAVRNSESARLVDAMSRIVELDGAHGAAEKERTDLGGRLAQAQEVIERLENELAAKARAHEDELRLTMEENEALKTKYATASGELMQFETRIVDLGNELSAVKAEKAGLERQMSDVLAQQAELRRKATAAAEAGNGAAALAGMVTAEAHKQRVIELQKQVELLADRVRKLTPYERLYRLSKARQCELAIDDKALKNLGDNRFPVELPQPRQRDVN